MASFLSGLLRQVLGVVRGFLEKRLVFIFSP